MYEINWTLENALSDERCAKTRELIRNAFKHNDLEGLVHVVLGLGAENIARLIRFDADAKIDPDRIIDMLGWAVEKLGKIDVRSSLDEEDNDDIPF